MSVGIPHTKGGLSNKYCWGQEQTVVKISALFRCLVLSSQLTPFTVNQHNTKGQSQFPPLGPTPGFGVTLTDTSNEALVEIVSNFSEMLIITV